MTSFSPEGVVGRVRAWIRGLPVLWTVAIAAVSAAVVGVAAYYAYETYDYVEHDNDFCLSCHLMEDPYERFARSAHRDLSCKACHQPTFTARSRMALTQIVQQPDTLVTHAEVPDQRCVGCHVEGDPEKWRQIASSAGHRIHLESDEASLRGLQCVECHSSSLHEFTATSTTCQQSGCHEDTPIRLGGMSDLTIHCVACHDFSTPVTRDSVPRGRDSLLAVAMRPRGEECLSCHAMRERLPDLPSPGEDPHRGACGACHQPHEQTAPAEAVERCADCHGRPDTLTAFHRGLRTGVLEGCTSCHSAHDFRVEGENCGACHRPGEDGGMGPPGTRVPHRSAANAVRASANRAPGPGRRSGPSASPAGAGAAARIPSQVRDTTRFRHDRHRDLACTVCHATDRSHGRVKLERPADCRSCHHTDEAGVDCRACHRDVTRPGSARSLRRTIAFSTGDTVLRTLPFDHAVHAELPCGACHGGGLARSARGTSCADCHEDHHRPEVRCGACHREAPAEAHPREAVHLTCGGAGCHDPAPLSASTRSRQQCLACHTRLVDHRPGRECTACHLLPPAREASG